MTIGSVSAIMRKAVGLGSNGFSKHNRLTGVVMSNYIVVNGIRIASDFEPETFGRLTTIGPRFMIGVKSYQVCQCMCGSISVANTNLLVSLNIKSCDCIRPNRSGENNGSFIHGETKKAKEYNSWRSMNDRCNCKTHSDYPDYGGRGITICDRWQEPQGKGYLNFLEDMGRKPSNQHSLDRIDVNGNYCKENCRWATHTEQARNKRNKHLLTAFGQTKSIAEWAEEYGLDYKFLHSRIRNGWEPERAIKQPKGSSR